MKHIRTKPAHESYMPSTDALRSRLEEDAEAILSGPMKRRHATAATRMAVANSLEVIVQRELHKARARA